MEDWRVSRGALKEPNDDEQVWWDVIERVFDELAIPYEPDPRLERLTPGQRALYALHWTRSEVGNGGFHQYLHNPTGMLAGEASHGAGLIGALEIGDVLRCYRVSRRTARRTSERTPTSSSGRSANCRLPRKRDYPSNERGTSFQG